MYVHVCVCENFGYDIAYLNNMERQRSPDGGVEQLQAKTTNPALRVEH